MLFHFFVLFISSDPNGIGGFVNVKFPFNGDKSTLFSKLTVIVRTPQGSLVDQTEVQPTGYWIVPVPSYRDLVVSVRSTNGIILAPSTVMISYPFNNDVDFDVMGFMAYGSVQILGQNGEHLKVTAPLSIEINGNGLHLVNKTLSDGTYAIGPLPPGDYLITVKDAVAQPQKIHVVDNAVNCEPHLITEWPQSIQIVFPNGVSPTPLSLLIKGPVEKTIMTDESGFLLLRNLPFGSYKVSSSDKRIAIGSQSFHVSPSEIPQPISIRYEGIKVQGFVMYPDHKPCPNVIVSLGSFTESTNPKGRFEFGPLLPQSGLHVSAFKEFFVFSKQDELKIGHSPIDDIIVYVVEAEISGKIECPHASITISGSKNMQFEISNQSFSISAPYGKEVNIAVKSNCVLATNSAKVTAPTSVVFAKVKASLKGSVECLKSCSKNIFVVIKNEKFEFSGLVNEDGSFMIDNAESGHYDLIIRSPPTNEWILKEKKVSLTQQITQIGNVASQNCYVYNVTSSHQMSVMNGAQKLNLVRGLNTIRTKDFIVTPGDCHIFSPVDLRTTNRIIVTSAERKINVIGSNLENSKFEVFVFGEKINPPYIFNHTIDSSSVAEISVVAPYYAEPPKLTIPSFSTCSESALQFEIIKGIEYKGRVFPPIMDVTVIAYSNGKIISVVSTNINGEYSLGSFPSNQNISIAANKTYYQLTQRSGTYDFDAIKLSSISVIFENGSNLKTEGILLAISRSDGYKNSFIMEKSQEEATITDLVPGVYFVKPILREYQFTPSQVLVEMKASSHQTISFSVNKTRFGISGIVQRITGEPEPDVEITAMHPNGETQIEVTDAQGKFRIGGLIPNQTYTLIPHTSATSAASKVTPLQIKVRLGEEDYQGVRFLSIKQSQRYDILGDINIDSDLLDALNIILMTPSGSVVERFTFPSKKSKFFYFLNLTDDKYQIAVASTRQHSTELNCPKVDVDKKVPQSQVSIECNIIHRQETIKKPILASFISLSFIIIWICILNYKAIGAKFSKPKKRHQ